MKTCDCGYKMELEVCRSAAGYYVGFVCNNCGPYDRLSGYFKTWEEAEECLTEEFNEE
jgi:hypothetical protein